MKILFIGQTLATGSGWGRYAWEIVRRIKQKHDVRVLVEEKSDKDIDQVVISRTTNFFKLFKNILFIRMHAQDFDIVHALDGWPYGVLAKFSGKPYYINAIGSYSVSPLEQFGKAMLLKSAYKNALRIFSISNFTRDEIRKRVRLDNIEVVHLGVDGNLFKLQNLKRDPNFIVSVGALKHRKGYHIALQAIKILKDTHPNVRYEIIGRADQQGYAISLQQYIKDHNLEKNVRFIKDMADDALIKRYNEASAFLLLPINHKNNFEGFGLVFTEAASCGLPVVGTMGNGGEDAVLDRQNGFLVQQNNPSAAAMALQEILETPETWQKFSDRGLMFAKKFDWNNTSQAYMNAYETNIRKI